MKANSISFDEKTYEKLAAQGKTVVFVVKDDVLQGMIALADIIRKSSYQLIKELRERGIETVMMTGDNSRVANYVGEQLGLSKVIAEVLPHEKSKNVKELKEGGKKVAMIGDGINDAPALAEADLGIAIGAGTDVAIETANVVLVNSNPNDILNILKLSKATSRPKFSLGSRLQHFCHPFSCRCSDWIRNRYYTSNWGSHYIAKYHHMCH